jgi:hypothetical protein
MFTIDTMLRHAEGWNGADALAKPALVDAFADRFDDSAGLVADARWHLRLLKVSAFAKENFGTVETDGLDMEADFAGARLLDRFMLQLHNAGVAYLMAANDLRHGVLLWRFYGDAEPARPAEFGTRVELAIAFLALTR